MGRKRGETRESVGKRLLSLQTHSFGRFLSSKNLENIFSETDFLPRRVLRSGVRHCRADWEVGDNKVEGMSITVQMMWPCLCSSHEIEVKAVIRSLMNSTFPSPTKAVNFLSISGSKRSARALIPRTWWRNAIRQRRKTSCRAKATSDVCFSITSLRRLQHNTTTSMLSCLQDTRGWSVVCKTQSL